MLYGLPGVLTERSLLKRWLRQVGIFAGTKRHGCLWQRRRLKPNDCAFANTISYVMQIAEHAYGYWLTRRT